LYEGFPEGGLFAPAVLVADGVPFPEIFRFDDDIGHDALDQIGKGFFRFPEAGDAQVEGEGDDDQTEKEAGKVKGAVSAQEAPAEAVDYPHHGIDVVEEAPLFRDDVAAEADRRDIEAELDHEGDDIAEVPVFDVQGGDPQSGAEAGQQGQDDKAGEVEDLPARQELIPDHHGNEDSKTDEEIYEGRNKGGRRNDHPWKIDLTDEIGIIDKAVGGLGQGIGKKRPGQHGSEYQ